MDGRKICYVHVGTHKTGTTSIQRFLAHNGGNLRAAGIHIPVTGRIPNHDGHHNIAWELQRNARFDPAFRTFAFLLSEIEAIGQPVACISSEELGLLHGDRTALRRLTDGFDSIGYEMRIIVFLRPQLEYVRAIWVELQRQNSPVSLSDVIDEAIAKGSIGGGPHPVSLEYDTLLDGFSAAVGKDHLIVRAFHSANDDAALIDAFTGIISEHRPIARGSVFVPGRINASPPIARDQRMLHSYAEAMDERFAPHRAAVRARYEIDIPVIGNALGDRNVTGQQSVGNGNEAEASPLYHASLP